MSSLVPVLEFQCWLTTRDTKDHEGNPSWNFASLVVDAVAGLTSAGCLKQISLMLPAYVQAGYEEVETACRSARLASAGESRRTSQSSAIKFAAQR